MVIGLNIYVYGFRESSNSSDIAIDTMRSAKEELHFIEGSVTPYQKETVSNILESRINGTRNKSKESPKLAKHKQMINSELEFVKRMAQAPKPIKTASKAPVLSHKSTTVVPVKDKERTKKSVQKKRKTTQSTNDFFIYRDYSVKEQINPNSRKTDIPIATTLKAILLTDLNSSIPANTVVAQVTHAPIKMKRYIGATILGNMKADIKNNRIFIDFDRLVINDKEININAIAQDQNGSDGIEAERKDNFSNDLLKEGIELGMDVLAAYVGSSTGISSIQEKSSDQIDTDIVLSIGKSESFNLFFQNSLKL
tara:strand:- start:573 stop:1502 length:930 start_codon:yes stop_codon:yes gene_type:complete